MKSLNKPTLLYAVFFMLAGLNLLAITISLKTSEQLIGNFNQVLKESSSWLGFSESFSSFESSIQQINAPINDLFQTGNVAAEMKRQQVALIRFQELYSDLLVRATRIEDIENSEILSSLDDIHRKTLSMAEAEKSVFNDFQKKQIARAGAQMAKVDQIFAQALQATNRTHQFLFKQQAESLKKQNLKSNNVAKTEYLLGCFGLLLVVGACAFGWWLIQRIRAYELQLEEERQRLTYAGKMSALGEMAGGIAHEINNPLAIIQSWAGQLRILMQRGELHPEQLDKAVDRIEQTCQRITKIIRGLISFAREGESEPMQPVSVQTVIDETLNLCSEKFKVHGVQLIWKGSPPGLRISCRPVLIQQVLLNLLNNAFDAVAESSDKWVKLEVSVHQAFVQFSVFDSGHGVPVEVRDKIMVPFFTTKPIGQGTGLGLSISKGIIDSHGGNFRLDEKSQFTCFVFELPLATSEPRPKLPATTPSSRPSIQDP